MLYSIGLIGVNWESLYANTEFYINILRFCFKCILIKEYKVEGTLNSDKNTKNLSLSYTKLLVY